MKKITINLLFIFTGFVATTISAQAASVSDLTLGTYENDKLCDLQIQTYSELGDADLIYANASDCGAFTLSANVFRCDKGSSECRLIMGRTVLANEDCRIKILAPGKFEHSCTLNGELKVGTFTLKRETNH